MDTEWYRVGLVYVHVRPGPLDTFCHIWCGAMNSKGYPVRTVDGKRVSGHRRAWEEVHGPMPAGHQAHHRCQDRRCINPDHIDADYDAVRIGLRRSVKAGRVEKIGRGLYASVANRRGNPFTREGE